MRTNRKGVTWLEWRRAARLSRPAPLKVVIEAMAAWESGQDPESWKKENQNDG